MPLGAQVAVSPVHADSLKIYAERVARAEDNASRNAWLDRGIGLARTEGDTFNVYVFKIRKADFASAVGAYLAAFDSLAPLERAIASFLSVPSLLQRTPRNGIFVPETGTDSLWAALHVEAGLALAELIAGMKKPTVSLVLGGGHSIGVPLAVSAKRSFITPSSGMTIHPVRMNGTVLGVPQTMAYFENIQERIVRFVVKNSRIRAERFRELMLANGNLMTDVGTILNGEDAVKEGLMDSLGSLSDALEALDQMIGEGKQTEGV